MYVDWRRFCETDLLVSSHGLIIKKYVNPRIPCASAKELAEKGYLRPTPKEPVPFYTVDIDHLGSFIKSKTGNTYILGIIDGFTKFITLRAVKNTNSKTNVATLRDVFGILELIKH